MTRRAGWEEKCRAGSPDPAETSRIETAGSGDPGLRCQAWLAVGAISTALAAFTVALPVARSAEPPSVVASGTRVAPDSAAAAILHGLRTFESTGRVLHVGAHPDDENTQLIAYLSRGRGYDTAYLSITRGDGGQNILGPQLGEELGVARTEELLAARRIDGGRQFFTRAIDFGFSKTPEETLSIWNHREVLGDVVRIIRQFKPDVIVTRFPIPPGSGGHGHHTASAILAVEAFKLAGDPKAYPEQLAQGLAPWQPKRIVWNSSGFSRGGGIEKNPSIKIDIGGYDPVTGEAFSAIAARSRAMHKTQDFGGFRTRDNGGPRLETFVWLGGDRPTQDLMDGVDPTWGRITGGADIGRLAAEVIAHFDRANPAASVPAMLAMRKQLEALPSGTIVDDKRAQLDRILQRCLGLEVRSWGESATVIPGESMPGRVTATVSATTVPVHWVGVDFPGGHVTVDANLRPGAALFRDITFSLAPDAPVHQPYWLRHPSAEGISRVDDPALIGRPENPIELPVRYTFRIGDQTLTITDAPFGGHTHKTGEMRPMVVVPPVAMAFPSGPALVRPGVKTDVELELKGARGDVSGTVRLAAPAGWSVSPPQPFHTGPTSQPMRVTFEVTAPTTETTAALQAWAKVDGREWSYDPVTIHYSHIPFELIQRPAEKKVVCAAIATRGRAIGYIMGAGDDVPEALQQLGYHVVSLTAAEIAPEKLRGFDAVVVGVRAFNVREDLVAHAADLFAYAEAGGTVVCQYNWSRGLVTKDLAPYPLTLSDLRITDEAARVTFLAPDHPVLTTPNRITAADFDGWVQERGTYYPRDWDPHFTPVLEMNDPGEAPLKGALLVAPCGKGWFVYTGLAFFRQLPAGVPGAYRLLANLVSLGK